MSEHPSNPAWIAMLVSGIANLLWALVYIVWTVIALAMGGFNTINMFMNDTQGSGGGFVMLITMLAPVIQGIFYLVAIPLAAVSIFAALRLRSWRSKGVVWLGTILCVGVPILGVLFSLLSFCNCSNGACCLGGFVLGNVGTIPVLVIGLAATIWGGIVMFSETATIAFADNEYEA